MKKIIACLVLLSFSNAAFGQRSENYIQYVNPLIGTQKMGHTYPGATVPFGSVQLSPDTDEQPHNINGNIIPKRTNTVRDINMTTRRSSVFRIPILAGRATRTLAIS